MATTGHLPHANTQWPPVSCYVRDEHLYFIPERPIGEGSRVAYQFSGGFIFYFPIATPPDNTPTSVKGYITTPPESDQGTCEAVLVAYVPG